MRILVTPELLRDAAQQMRRATDDVRQSAERAHQALGRVQWEAQQKPIMEKHAADTRRRGTALVEKGEELSRGLGVTAARFEGADRAGVDGFAVVSEAARSLYQQSMAGAAAFSIIPASVGATLNLGQMARDFLSREPRPLPRVYIINGITGNNRETDPADNDHYDMRRGKRSVEMVNFMQGSTDGHHAYPSEYVTSTIEIYNRPQTDGWHPGPDAAHEKNFDTNDVKDEMKDGQNGYYTKLTEKWILDDIKKNGLLPGQEILLIGHSGGGAVAANMTSILDGHSGNRAGSSPNEDIRVAGLVTMGSPYVDWARVPEDVHTVAINALGDQVGDPAFFAGDWGDESPDRHYEKENTSDSMYVNVGSRHNSYMTSERVLDLIGREFPDVGRELAKGNRPK